MLSGQRHAGAVIAKTAAGGPFCAVGQDSETHQKTKIAALMVAALCGFAAAPGLTPPCNLPPRNGPDKRPFGRCRSSKAPAPTVNSTFDLPTVPPEGSIAHFIIRGSKGSCSGHLVAQCVRGEVKSCVGDQDSLFLILNYRRHRCVCVCVHVREITWYEVGVGRARPGLAAVPGALVPSGEQDVAVTDAHLGAAGVAVGPLGPAGPALCGRKQHSPCVCVSVCSV